MNWNDLFSKSYQYGMPVVYSIVLLFIIYKFASRVLDSYERRETTFSKLLNDGMANMALALKEISVSNTAMHQNHALLSARLSQDLKDGFDRLIEISKFQRADLQKMTEKMDKGYQEAELAREKILNEISKQECKA